MELSALPEDIVLVFLYFADKRSYRLQIPLNYSPYGTTLKTFVAHAYYHIVYVLKKLKCTQKMNMTLPLSVNYIYFLKFPLYFF